ncbi:MAG: hypothetical protein K6E40_14195 [Desulfovibrio sp.]|nr:hypothetical protein [Desulfovibrio sp.]
MDFGLVAATVFACGRKELIDECPDLPGNGIRQVNGGIGIDDVAQPNYVGPVLPDVSLVSAVLDFQGGEKYEISYFGLNAKFLKIRKPGDNMAILLTIARKAFVFSRSLSTICSGPHPAPSALP